MTISINYSKEYYNKFTILKESSEFFKADFLKNRAKLLYHFLNKNNALFNIIAFDNYNGEITKPNEKINTIDLNFFYVNSYVFLSTLYNFSSKLLLRELWYPKKVKPNQNETISTYSLLRIDLDLEFKSKNSRLEFSYNYLSNIEKTLSKFYKSEDISDYILEKAQ